MSDFPTLPPALARAVAGLPTSDTVLGYFGAFVRAYPRASVHRGSTRWFASYLRGVARLPENQVALILKRAEYPL